MSEPGVEDEAAATESGAVTGGSGAHVVSLSRPVVLPETFDGTRNWDEWVFHFLGRGRVSRCSRSTCSASCSTTWVNLSTLLSSDTGATKRSSRRAGRRQMRGGQTLRTTSKPSSTKGTHHCRTKPESSWQSIISFNS